MVSPARAAAYETVLRVFEQEAYADRALRTAAASLDQRDRAFAQRLAYGSIQRVRTLDYAIEQLGRRPVRKLDPPVRAALRLGAYELGFMQTPRHAAVNEAVELVRAAKLERAVAFTNAVLRRVAEGIDSLLASLPDGALKHSYPDWVELVWTPDFGRDEALALMRARTRRRRRSCAWFGVRSKASRPTSRAPIASSGSTKRRSPKAGSGRRAVAPSSPASS